MSATLLDEICSGLEALKLDTSKAECYLAYLELLQKWNKVYNLTAIRDPRQMVVLHLMDSLAVWPYLSDCRRLADVGSGAGLPGIPLAIAMPKMQVSLIEANHKKASFLQQARIELGLNNLQVHAIRVEKFKPQEAFPVVISRAFADLALYLRVAGHLAGSHSRLLAMKAHLGVDEGRTLPSGWRISAHTPLSVPGLQAQRQLVALEHF